MTLTRPQMRLPMPDPQSADCSSRPYWYCYYLALQLAGLMRRLSARQFFLPPPDYSKQVNNFAL